MSKPNLVLESDALIAHCKVDVHVIVEELAKNISVAHLFKKRYRLRMNICVKKFQRSVFEKTEGI